MPSFPGFNSLPALHLGVNCNRNRTTETTVSSSNDPPPDKPLPSPFVSEGSSDSQNNDDGYTLERPEVEPINERTPTPEPTIFKIFKITTLGSPDKRSIFVELHADGTGYMYQVTGCVKEADMEYESRPWGIPESDPDVIWREFLGFVDRKNINRVGEVCSSICPPKKQYNENGKRLNRKIRLRQSKEWASEVVETLREARIIM